MPTGNPACGTLPPNILQKLFAHLSNDKQTLSQCSLVCHAWLTTSRPLLFETLHILLGPPRPASYPDRLGCFDQFLSEHSHLSSLVKYLTVCNGHSSGVGRPLVRLKDLASSLNKLNNLLQLHVEGVAFISYKYPPIPLLHLDRLYLSGVPAVRKGDTVYGSPFLDLIGHFSSLSTLSIDTSVSPPWLHGLSLTPLTTLPTRVQLQCLSIIDSGKAGYELPLSMLVRAIDITALSQFASRVNSFHDILPLGGFLRKMRNVSYLRLSLAHADAISQVQWSILGLYAHPSLCSLHLSITLPSSCVDSGANAFRSIVPLISSLCVPPCSTKAHPVHSGHVRASSFSYASSPSADNLSSNGLVLPCRQPNEPQNSGPSLLNRRSSINGPVAFPTKVLLKELRIHLTIRTSLAQVIVAFDKFRWFAFAVELYALKRTRGVEKVILCVHIARDVEEPKHAHRGDDSDVAEEIVKALKERLDGVRLNEMVDVKVCGGREQGQVGCRGTEDGMH